ncbi:hypothetical protein D9758_005111 [Tetrapyrgos nigripes]|uniref:C2H2-type domain-containing protein n=1 Tax=Tetrapyrgos nigripes TaxID=182062 RepID=A0A8H5LWH9_9AGAR|nr:hypothetical protein D9758_005111 [Tetrapyrgos nigripes]
MGRISCQDTYSGQLFHHGHGCALWNPEPNRNGISSQDRWKGIYEEGVRIGDVGLISDSGDFTTLFNIFRPPGDLVNEPHGVPPGFEPLELRENLYQFSNGLYHLENARVSSKYTQEIKLGADGTVLAPGIPVTPGIGLEYQSSREQGAVLILPKGACRVDYRGLRHIRDYATRNAESWYRYLNDQVGMDADNGSLYVITGFDRTSCYENLSFNSSSINTSISFKFSCPLLPNGDFGSLSLSYSSLPEHEHWKRSSNPDHTLHNLSPFIRGFKIMIRRNFRYKPTIKILDLVKADPKALLYKGSIPSLSSSGSASLSSSSNSLTVRSPAPPSTSSTSGSSTRSSRHSDSQSSSQSPRALDLSPITSYSSLAGDTDSARSGSLSPRGSSIFDSDSDSESGMPGSQLHHPSDVINEYVLYKCPDTNVAITHDDEWASVLEESDSQFPDKSTLISRMLDKFPSKFEQTDSKDNFVLGTLMSPTLRRIDPCRASTPSKRKSPETPAITTVALPPDDESTDGKTKMLSGRLDEHPYVDDANGFVSSKRRKLSSDNILVIDDTQSSSKAIPTDSVVAGGPQHMNGATQPTQYTMAGDASSHSSQTDSVVAGGPQHMNGATQPTQYTMAGDELSVSGDDRYLTVPYHPSQYAFRLFNDTTRLPMYPPRSLHPPGFMAYCVPPTIERPQLQVSEDQSFDSHPHSIYSLSQHCAVHPPTTPPLGRYLPPRPYREDMPAPIPLHLLTPPYAMTTLHPRPDILDFQSLSPEYNQSQSSFSPPASSPGYSGSETGIGNPACGDFVGKGGVYSNRASSSDGMPFVSWATRDAARPHLDGASCTGIAKKIVASPANERAARNRRLGKNKKSYTCDLCSRSFTAKHNLTHHTNSHFGIRNFQCEDCERTFVTKHVLKRHWISCKKK